MTGFNGMAFGFVASEPILSGEESDALAFGVDSESIVEGFDIETHYQELSDIIFDEAHRCLRVISGAGIVDVETRIPFALLERSGWELKRVRAG